MPKIELIVSGMKCSGCENRIKNALTTLEEVKEVKANHKTNQVVITLKEEATKEIEEKIAQIINDLDFTIVK